MEKKWSVNWRSGPGLIDCTQGLKAWLFIYLFIFFFASARKEREMTENRRNQKVGEEGEMIQMDGGKS